MQVKRIFLASSVGLVVTIIAYGVGAPFFIAMSIGALIGGIMVAALRA